jgi:DNA-binding SARP family transcriptional activator
MSGLNIHLFGSVRVEYAGQEIPMRPASRAILLYLLLHRPKFHRREVLSSLFWGDMGDSRARRCLNSALWRLRQELKQTIHLVSNRQGDIRFELQQDDHVDVMDFEAVAHTTLQRPPHSLDIGEVGLLEQTAALYEGDLAEDCFYDWVLPERERLRTLYLDMLNLIMYAHSQQGAYDQAIRAGQQILQCEPLREDIHRYLMRLYIVTEQRSRALHQYMVCWQVLNDELQLTPMPETAALYEQIIGRAPLTGLTDVRQRTASIGANLPSLSRLKEMLESLQIEVQHILQALQDVEG